MLFDAGSISEMTRSTFIISYSDALRFKFIRSDLWVGFWLKFVLQVMDKWILMSSWRYSDQSSSPLKVGKVSLETR